jgi:acetyl esterase/lipase
MSGSAEPTPAPAPRSWSLWLLECAFSLVAARSFAGGEAGVRWLARVTPPAPPSAPRGAEPLAGAPPLFPTHVFEAGASASDAAAVSVLYLPGGAYALPASSLHPAMCARLAAALAAATGARARVALAHYPLSLSRPSGVGPSATLDAAEAALRALAATARGGRLVIAGDSAGGGLALALAQRVAAGGDVALARRVAALALLSPWCDVSLSLAAEMRPLEARCCMLRVEGLAAAGRLYCNAGGEGGCGARDAAASPLFGEMRGLPPVTLTVGTRELLLPEGRALRAALAAAGVRVSYIEESLPHVWPLFAGAGVPEGERGLAAVVAAIAADLGHTSS